MKPSKGNDKKVLQSLILTAVVYEQLEYERLDPARRTAAKAISLLRKYHESVPEPFDPDLLLTKLNDLDQAAPVFTHCGQQ